MNKSEISLSKRKKRLHQRIPKRFEFQWINLERYCLCWYTFYFLEKDKSQIAVNLILHVHAISSVAFNVQYLHLANLKPATSNSQLVTRKLGTCSLGYLSSGVQLDQWSLQGSPPFWVAREASCERTRDWTIKVRGAVIAWVSPFACSTHVFFHISQMKCSRAHWINFTIFTLEKRNIQTPKMAPRSLYTIAWFAFWMLATNRFFFKCEIEFFSIFSSSLTKVLLTEYN